ncbi:centromere protein F [Pseudophryne corroboree]|uniref:centromere protein F n=1 Tax=Pseudophryne corroboree TaxID=495146 RepID=UPI00308209C0
MSWVVEEWKEGLPTKTLHKIQELEGQVDKLKKDRQQRQFQLESLEAAIQKQKQKVESEKGEVTALKRENQSLIELCDNLEKTRQKLTHEQQVKETQVNILEGQLGASKKHIEKLEQELKRYKNDLERSQQSFNAGDMSVCVTPQKSVTVSFTPVTFSDPKYEELQEKYGAEVEERKRLETELKLLQIKMVNHSSQPPSQNTMNHRDIARHQTSSSVFSWQQEPTPSRAPSGNHDSSLKRSFPTTQCPWEQEETPSKRSFKPDNCNRSFCDSYSNPANDQLKIQNQELRTKVTELELRLQVQERELKNHLHKLQETRTLLEKSQAELVEKDRALTKSRDDSARVTAQLQQSADKCAQTEQKLKKVSEELSCQRQNAESARLAVEHKLKEREKENQQELLRQQNSLKNMEQQLNQMKTKLAQESQQAKNEFNAIQAELDRVTHGKKSLESEVEELKQKLLRAEQTLHASESQGSDIRRNLEEAKSQQNAITSQLDQKAKEALKLEEELSSAKQTIRQNQQFMEELKHKNNSLEADLKTALQKLQGQDSASLQHLTVAITKLEKERDSAQEVLKKRERDAEEARIALDKVMEESQALKNQLDCKERECRDLINTHSSLVIWKKEHEDVTETLSREREEMSVKNRDLESAIQTRMDQINVLEQEKKHLDTQIKALQDNCALNTADMDILRVTCRNLQQQLETESQKHRNETGDLMKKISELEAQRDAQESSASSEQMLHLESELEQLKKLNGELKSQNEKLLESQSDIQKKLVEVEEMQERFASQSRSQFESFQDNISCKQNVDSLVSAIKEKEEEIGLLSEKLRLANADIQSAHQSNRELNDKLQELSLQSESWSTERATLTALITSLQQDIDRLTADPKKGDLPNYEQKQMQNANADLKIQETAVPDTLTFMEEDSPVGGCSAEMKKEYENVKLELAEWKENLCRAQAENNRLLGVNKEMSALVEKLQNNELSLNKIVDDLRVCLKETSLKTIQEKFEKLKPDHEDNGNPPENLQKLFQNNIESDNEINLMKQTLDGSESPKEMTLLGIRDPILIMEDCDVTSVNDSYLLVDVTEGTSSFPLSTEPQDHCENETLLINLDQLTLMTSDGDSTRTLPVLPDLVQQNSTALSPSAENSDARHRETQGLIDLLLRQFPQQQSVLFSGIENENALDLKYLLTFYQTELSNLQKQHLAENALWQQKLRDQALELEAKLAAEMARSDGLSRELDAARLELQVLNLSAHSLLSFNSDDLTTKLDATDQTICTFLPISSLSLGNAELQRSEYPKHERQSPEELNAGEPTDVENLDMISDGNVDHTGNVENSSGEKKVRKDSNSEVHVDNTDPQVISERLQFKAPKSLYENQKLLQLINEKEQINQNLILEVKDLSAQIEKQRAELTGKQIENQELGSKTEELQNERLQLLEKIELICNERVQSMSRIADLEKELQNTLNTMEIVKAQTSGVQESLEISNREWKENCLQTESELRRVMSEKANVEAHALSLEADLDSLHSQCQHLQEEREDKLKSCSDLQEHLNVALAQKHQLNQELETLLEEKEDLEQMHKKLKEREAELESSKSSSKEIIKILEADTRALKEELQAARSTAEQLIAEHDETSRSQENERAQLKELQSLVLQIQEEKNLLCSEQDALQTRLSAVGGESDKLSRALECCQKEKRELSLSLSSAQEEVALMRTGIEKLKVRIESDERKQRHAIEKLKESERKFDGLNDKIETMERELLVAEENLENAILQAETAKEEAEVLTSQKETLEIELNSVRRKLWDLEKEHLISQEKIADLEATVVTVTNTLESKEAEHTLYRENSEEQQALLHTQLEEIREQKALSDRRCEAATAEHADMTARIEEYQAQFKVKIESDERKQRHAIEKLKESERKFDGLSDKIETMERELLVAEENLENAILQAETAKEEAEVLTSQKETLEIELSSVRRKLWDLENEHLSSQEKIADLEATVVTVTNTLERKEAEHTLYRENSEEQQALLHTQLEEIREQKALSDRRCEAATAEHADMMARIEEHQAQFKVKIESDETIQHHAIEKLKESERKFDGLNDKIETMERELLMAEENLENAILQAETAKEAAEGLTSQKETLEMELNSVRRKLWDLEKEHVSSQEKIADLEATVVTIINTLERKEAEHTVYRENSEEQQALLHTQLEEMREQKALSDRRCEAATAEHADMTARIEEHQAQLEEAKMVIGDLKVSIEKLAAELKECRVQLSEKSQQLAERESQCKAAEQREMTCSAELSRLEEERETLISEKKSLQTAVEDLEGRVRDFSAGNDSLHHTVTGLEAQLEAVKSGRQALVEQVVDLEERCSSFHRKLQEAAVQLKAAEEQNRSDRNGWDEELRAMRRRHEESGALLLAATSETADMEKTVAGLQGALESQAQQHKDDIMEYENRLLQADSRHQSLLADMVNQHKGDIDLYQEKLTSAEAHLNAHRQEIDGLRGCNGELSESLCKAQEQLAELQRLKVTIDQVKKENAKNCKNFRHWMSSCKKLEQEKERLQQEILQQEEACKGVMQKPADTNMNTSAELKQCLEEKTLEADESVEKYCNLLIKTHKLEDTNDALTKQVTFLTSRLREAECKQEDSTPSPASAVPISKSSRRGGKGRRSTQGPENTAPGPGKQANKRQRESDDPGHTPTTPQCVTKKVRKTGTNTAQEEKFEPEGLPEVVRKGFADIPSGKRSPFILRRTAVPLRKSPRLHSQANSPSITSTQMDDVENLADPASPPAGGSKSQMSKSIDASLLRSDLALMHVSSPLSTHNKLTSRAAESPCTGRLEEDRACVAPLHDQSEEEGTCHVQ